MHSHTVPDGSSVPASDDVAVLIIGGGPCGLLQAYLLAQLSIKSLVIERYAERLAAPKAHALSPRSLEICRQFLLDVRHIRSRGTCRDDAFWVNFVTSLNGQHVGRLPYERMDEAVLDDTPEMIHNIPQPDFEQIISDRLSRSDLVEIRRNQSFVSCLQSVDGSIYTTVEERSSGTTYTIRSRYLIAADGARSYVRRFLQIPCTGEQTAETMMTIHFHADLRPVCGSKVGILHWIMDPMVSGFIIGYDLSGNQVLICNFDSQKHPVDTWDRARCLQILQAAIGKETMIEVQSWRPWIFKREIAEQYRVGNVFLVGDAAHSFPPTGGLGLNSGLADAHNLAYKIAFVLRGWATDSLLDSYQYDRRHVAEINSQQSVKNGKKIFGLLKALGTATQDIDRARNNLYQSINDVQKREHIDQEIQEQQEHFDNLELHIGYVYGSTVFPPHASHYSPKYVQGARLPHAWVKVSKPELIKGIAPVDLSYISELSQEKMEACRWSTLDLCGLDSFTLLQADTFETHERAAEIRRLLECDEVRSATTPEGSGFHAASQPSMGQALRIVTYGRDFGTLAVPASEAFVKQAHLTETLGGGVLVRPDQHILLMVEQNTTARDIVSAIKKHLAVEQI